jgi:hypothetical protein
MVSDDPPLIGNSLIASAKAPGISTPGALAFSS